MKKILVPIIGLILLNGCGAEKTDIPTTQTNSTANQHISIQFISNDKNGIETAKVYTSNDSSKTVETKAIKPKESSFVIEEQAEKKFALNIKPVPSDSKITIENIKENYFDGISLKEGKYTVLVEKSGFVPKRLTVKLHSDLDVDVSLEAIKKQTVSQITFSQDERDGLTAFFFELGFSQNEIDKLFDENPKKLKEIVQAISDNKLERLGKILDSMGFTEDVLNEKLAVKLANLPDEDLKLLGYSLRELLGFSDSEIKQMIQTKPYGLIQLLKGLKKNDKDLISQGLADLGISEQELANRMIDNRFSIGSYTFTDKISRLMWQKKSRYYGDPESYSEPKYSWREAINYCDRLNLDGYSDWRLPSRDELRTLRTANYGEDFRPRSLATLEQELEVYLNRWSPWFEANKYKLVNNLFVPKEIAGFMPPYSWSSSSAGTVDNIAGAWIVDFYNGDDDWVDQANGDFVVCVRDL